jgi:predicted membrane protein
MKNTFTSIIVILSLGGIVSAVIVAIFSDNYTIGLLLCAFSFLLATVGRQILKHK